MPPYAGRLMLPNRCPKCQSIKVAGLDTPVCADCGALIELAPIVICPHCKEIDSIVIEGGKEYCNICWLDPSKTDLPSPEIAHLYRGNIRLLLEKNLKALQPHKSWGKYVRTLCGPHCPWGEGSCPQETTNLSKCISEERDGLDAMSRRHKHRQNGNPHPKLSKRERKEARKEAARLKTAAIYRCSKGGWFEEVRYRAHNTYKQEDRAIRSFART